MREDFIVKLPHLSISKDIYKAISSLIISFIIVYPIIGITSIQAVVALIILSIIFFILISNMSLENKSSSLPSTSYPEPPHLGLDGISLDSLTAGTSLSIIG